MSNSRIPGRNFLFVPGPTNLPDRVQRAMQVARKIIARRPSPTS